MFWVLVGKKKLTTTKKVWVLFLIFFYQICAGNPGIYIYSRGATENLYCSGTISVYKVKPTKTALKVYVEGSESPPSTWNAYNEDTI